MNEFIFAMKTDNINRDSVGSPISVILRKLLTLIDVFGDYCVIDCQTSNKRRSMYHRFKDFMKPVRARIFLFVSFCITYICNVLGRLLRSMINEKFEFDPFTVFDCTARHFTFSVLKLFSWSVRTLKKLIYAKFLLRVQYARYKLLCFFWPKIRQKNVANATYSSWGCCTYFLGVRAMDLKPLVYSLAIYCLL